MPEDKTTENGGEQESGIIIVSPQPADTAGQPPETKKRKGRDSFKLLDSPVFGISVVMLFTLGVVLLPGEKIGALMLREKGDYAMFLGNAIFRFIGFFLFVFLTVDLGFEVFGFKGRGKGFLLSLPFIIVAVNNAPIVGRITGEVTISGTALQVFLFTLYCLSVGLFEEIVFRGVVFPMVLRKMGKTRKGTFWSVIISSALFGGIHAVNFLSGAPGPVVLQIGYSFLIGAMCAMVMLMCRNVFACALLHAGFDFAGLIADAPLGSGQLWNAANITLTAAVGVLAVLYAVFLMIKVVKPNDKLF